MTYRLLNFLMNAATSTKEEETLEAKFLVYTSAILIAGVVLYLGLSDGQLGI